MGKILEEILWSIYYQTDHKHIGAHNDARFFILNDILKDLHNFSAEQLRSAVVDLNKQKLIEKKNYEKSAQFFKTFLIQYPTSEKIDDRFLFQAGIAAFESGQHYDWALSTMDRLVNDYPESKYFRGAK